MPNQPIPEDDESTPLAGKAKRLFQKKKIILGTVAFVATGLLLRQLAKGQDRTEGIESNESLDDRTPTPGESAFASMVNDVAGRFGNIKSVRTIGYDVEAKFRSRSGKQVWTAWFHFDDETGHYNYSHPYPGAGWPFKFGDEVGQRIREAVADWQSVRTD